MKSALVAVLAVALLGGCAARQQAPASKGAQQVIPRECMGEAEYHAGECESLSETRVRCKCVTFEMPIYCTRWVRKED